jgi:hypothetical protein
VARAMTAVHEYVHQRAGKQEQVWQDTEQMSPVLN